MESLFHKLALSFQRIRCAAKHSRCWQNDSRRRTCAASGKACRYGLCSGFQLVLGRLAIEEKSNEITAMPGLLDKLDTIGSKQGALTKERERLIAENSYTAAVEKAMAVLSEENAIESTTYLDWITMGSGQNDKALP